ncbi:protein DD3-3-like [Rhopilema esculentum]|uniref:protein DD3-3-like n=1 Tax=Rhopilema esculentum TaxID=499914 RepID=UPI0031DFC193|eukprot:gene2416-18065_t
MKNFLALFFIHCFVNADIYMHNPRGSNNRLDERGRERNNGNRLFDSQNNNRGGYNVGNLYYYAGSTLPIEWTNQHSCDNPNSNCEIIIQYMCGSRVRDGTTTTTIPENPVQCRGYDCNNDLRFGMHENYNYYMDCKYRQRNQGLFTADQQLKGKTSKYTRQNPGGTRRGYECPEERDYYPYWHPNPWKDIVIMTNDVTRCDYYQKESQNVKDKWACVPPAEYTKFARSRRLAIPIDKENCEKIVWPIGSINGTRAVWTKFPSHGIKAPECRETVWSRDNHLGNGKGGFTNKYDWILPKIEENNCVLRIRYNISTNDYDTWKTNASKNGNKQTDVNIGSMIGLASDEAKTRGYVFKNNPVVQPFGSSNKFQVRLAINTAQYGRTFQDRSHLFAIRKRPSNLENVKIVNLNVRGKRGNIVQVYPAVEYDFVPNRLQLGEGDYIHFQWTGSNTNPGNNDGQGLAGTDRSNVILLEKQKYAEGNFRGAGTKYGHFGNNYPQRVDKVTWLGLSRQDLNSLALLLPGQYGGEMSELDDAGTYFDLGPRKVTGIGTYFYMSTRNNNFSNRSQKGKIVVNGNAVVQRQVGWGGGNILLKDGSQGLWIEKDVLDGLKSIQLEEWSPDAGSDQLKKGGGSITVGDDFSSNFLAVYPMQRLTKDGKTFTVKLKVEESAGHSTYVYHSSDMKTWSKISDASISDGTATFKASAGGVYVARKHRDVGMIAGVSLACAFLFVLIIGTVIYCRKKPGTWDRTRVRFRNITRSLKSEV